MEVDVVMLGNLLVGIVVKVCIAPFGILLIRDAVLQDEYHFRRREEIDPIEVAEATHLVTYPVEIAPTLKQLLVDKGSKGIGILHETPYGLVLGK